VTEESDRDDGSRLQRLAIAMLTLRVNTPAGDWLSDDDLAVFSDLYRDALAEADGDSEGLVLTMMNLAWYGLIWLEQLSVGTDEERNAAEWLQVLATDLEAEA
jgi:hypothetical protein